jgi:DNA-binding NtrC family response regulator
MNTPRELKKEHYKHKLIFIVEDNEMYSFMLDYMLTNEHSLRCIRFEKGEECINSLELNPDMIILDYVLPGINGLETFRKIKTTKPEVPVVILTGHYDRQTAQQFLSEGVYHYMLKEENAVNKVKSLMEEAIDHRGEKEVTEAYLKRRTRRKRVALSVFCLTLVATIIYLLMSLQT